MKAIHVLALILLMFSIMNGDTIIQGIISPGENGKVTVKSADIQDPIPIEIAQLSIP